MKYEPDAKPRQPKNIAEAKVWNQLTKQGWNISKRGWPDFFCWKDSGEILFVEVKQRRQSNLKLAQRRVFHALESRGIPIQKIIAE
jgi:Holliday junction resolvase-like predicted endonuclease